MLKATVIINVIPARVKIVLKSFVMALFLIPSKVGIMLSRKLTRCGDRANHAASRNQSVCCVPHSRPPSRLRCILRIRTTCTLF